MLLRGKALLTLFFSVLVFCNDTYADSKTIVDEDVIILDSVIVSADKRESYAQEAPTAVTVMTGSELEKAGITNIQELLNIIPNTYTSSLVGSISYTTIRGKGTNGFIENSPVIIYVDGIPMDYYQNADPGLEDIERVEVLRGSQGTLYGKGSVGGVINIISKKPADHFEGRINTYAGNYSSYGVHMSVSTPVVQDKVYFSLSGSRQYTNGYMDNSETDDGNKSEKSRLKGQIRFTPSKQLTMNLISEYGRTDQGMINLVDGSHPTLDSVAGKDDRSENRSLSNGISVFYEMDSLIFESVTTQRRDTVDAYYDFSGYRLLGPMTSESTVDLKQDEYTQEFRLRNDSANGLKWLVGAYFGYKDRDYTSFGDMPNYGMSVTYDNTIKTRDYAAFVSAEIPVWEKMRISAALRYQLTEKEAEINNYYSLYAGGKMLLADGKDEDSWSAFQPKISVSFDITDDKMFYASIARGFQSGGFNWSYGSAVAPTPEKSEWSFDEQVSWDYELGFKSIWLKRMSLNTVLFYSDMKDLQVNEYIPSKGYYIVTNAGKAHSYGAEVDAKVYLMPELVFNASVAVVKAEYDEYSNAGANYDGKTVKETPEYTLSASLEYNMRSGFYVRGDVAQTGKTYWGEANDYSRSTTTVYGARAGYEQDDWSVYIYGKNLTDERYLTLYIPGSDQGYVAAPRTFGLGAEYRF